MVNEEIVSQTRTNDDDKQRGTYLLKARTQNRICTPSRLRRIEGFEAVQE